MTIKLIGLAVLAAMAVTAHAESKATYVGNGRYVCEGSSAACAQIDNINRQREAQHQYYSQRNQDRAQAYVDHERRKDDERHYQQSQNR